MESITEVITDLSQRNYPMLTWYGPDHERVDLTGKTAANWITKATNLLTVELDCGPDSPAWLDLPRHWRTVVWAHALWCTGAYIADPDESDLVITANPTQAHTHLDTIVIALPALARSVEDLPEGAIDGAGDLMTQPDSFIMAPQGEGAHPTGLGPSQQELLASPPQLTALHSPEEEPAQPRVLITHGEAGEVSGWVGALWAAGYGVVIAPDEASAASESITHKIAT